MNRYAVAALFTLACTNDAPPPAVARTPSPSLSASASASPAPSPSAPATTAREAAPAPTPAPPAAPKEAEKLTCFSNMPEQSCAPGCDAQLFHCAGDCGTACTTCTETTCAKLAGSAIAECESKCIATKDRCVTGDCGKKKSDCERREAAEIKKSYGCNKKDLGAACDELFTCLQDATCVAKGTCASVCEKKTGCDAAFQEVVSWNGCFPFHQKAVAD